MKIKHILNVIIDCFYEKKREKKTWEPLTNQGIIDGLKDGKLFICCLVSRNNNMVAKAISKISGPFSHIVAVCDMNKINGSIIKLSEKWALLTKLVDYYGETYNSAIMDYLVLASADENGMNYFDISEYQKREMVIFKIDCKTYLFEEFYGDKKYIVNDKTDDIIKDFLSPEVMNAHYDYTGLLGWIVKAWKWMYRKFDDERSYYCSEVVYDVFKKNCVKVANNSEPSPTDIYTYCKDRYKIAYNNLKKEY